MALTPEDVVNKRFNPTKFREGYDQDEVDDFLDEVVVELRRLGSENDELRQRLAASESRVSELQRNAGSAPSAPVSEQVPEPAPAAEPVAAPEPTPAPVAAAPAPAPDSVEHDTGGTNNLLQLARRLHEEHVREGIEKRDALIAEGHATAARLVSEAQESQRVQLGALEERKAGLESEISNLASFESEYRSKLKGYIEGQLRDLESSSAIGDDAPAPAAAASAPVSSASVSSAPGSIAPPPFASAPAPSGAAPSSSAAPASSAAPGSSAAPSSSAAPGSSAAPASAPAPGTWAPVSAPFGQQPGSASAPSNDRPGGFAPGA